MSKIKLEQQETKESQAKDNYQSSDNEGYDDKISKTGQNAILNDIDTKHVSKINRVCCFNIRDQWKMQSQIKVAFVILFSTIFLTLISITSFNIIKVSEIMKNSQNQLYISQAQKNLQIVSKKFDRLVTTHFKAGYNQIYSKFKRILFILKRYTAWYQNQKVGMIISQTLHTHNQILHSFNKDFITVGFVMQYTRTKVNQDQKWKKINISSTLSRSLTRSIHQSQIKIIPTFLATKLTIFGLNNKLPICTHVYNYRLTSNHLKGVGKQSFLILDQAYRKQNKVFDGFHINQPIYNNITYTTTVSLAQVLLDRKYNFKGITSSFMDISKFSKLFDLYFTQFTALLVNPSGQLLISPYTVTGNNMNLFFQNTLITGFNYEDWQQVQNLAKGYQITHNCSLVFLNSVSNILCRWNQIYNRSELIYATYQKKLDYYIVILLDEHQLLAQLYVQEQQLEDQLIYINIIFFCSLCGLFVFLLLGSSMMISSIFRPLRNITTYCQQINDKNHLKIISKRQNLIKIENIITQGVFRGFTLSFYNLVQRFTKLRVQRNIFCKQVESLKYPQNDAHMLEVSELLEQLQDTDEEIDLVTKWRGSSQLNYMDKYQLNQILTSPKKVNQIYNQRMLAKIYNKQVEKIQFLLSEFKYFSKQFMLKLIFQYYRRN